MSLRRKKLKKPFSVPEKKLPSHDEFSVLAEKAADVLENENESYRPKDSALNPGSLLDFSNDTIPIIVVPDLHARPHFIKNILDYKLKAETEFLKTDNDETVLSALEKGLLRIVCVGDALHTERTAERWEAIKDEFKKKKYDGDAMKEEMTEGLTLLTMVMSLKIAFPEYFHFLKGNHENIMNVTGGGDFSFKKYADEGQMVKNFMRDYYGDDVLYLVSLWESLLPLMYISPNCVISHAEPLRAFDREEIIDARLVDGVVEGLTWTDNDDAENGSVKSTINNLLPKEQQDSAVYIGGHRPVAENYQFRQNGKYIQIHNPTRQNIALVRADRKFNPDTDLVRVD